MGYIREYNCNLGYIAGCFIMWWNTTHVCGENSIKPLFKDPY